MAAMLRALRSHCDRVGWGTLTCLESALALTPGGPSIRFTICSLNASVYATVVLPPVSRCLPDSPLGDNYPDTGGLRGRLNFNSALSYREIVNHLGGLHPETRGSGTKASVLASFLAWNYRDRPHEAIVESANCFGSDTDTIASMAGALLGACCDIPPPGKVMDEEYIIAEADRMAVIRRGNTGSNFSYPDLLRWIPPRTQVDILGRAGRELFMAGLGLVSPLGRIYAADKHSSYVYQWVRLKFGQTILAKRREPPVELNPQLVTRGDLFAKGSQELVGQEELFGKYQKQDNGRLGNTSSDVLRPLTVDEATQRAIDSKFDPAVVGRILLDFASGSDGIERAMGYAAIIVKARMARLRSKNGGGA